MWARIASRTSVASQRHTTACWSLRSEKDGVPICYYMIRCLASRQDESLRGGMARTSCCAAACASMCATSLQQSLVPRFTALASALATLLRSNCTISCCAACEGCNVNQGSIRCRKYCALLVMLLVQALLPWLSPASRSLALSYEKAASWSTGPFV